MKQQIWRYHIRHYDSDRKFCIIKQIYYCNTQTRTFGCEESDLGQLYACLFFPFPRAASLLPNTTWKDLLAIQVALARDCVARPVETIESHLLDFVQKKMRQCKQNGQTRQRTSSIPLHSTRSSESWASRQTWCSQSLRHERQKRSSAQALASDRLDAHLRWG